MKNIVERREAMEKAYRTDFSDANALLRLQICAKRFMDAKGSLSDFLVDPTEKDLSKTLLFYASASPKTFDAMKCAYIAEAADEKRSNDRSYARLFRLCGREKRKMLTEKIESMRSIIIGLNESVEWESPNSMSQLRELEHNFTTLGGSPTGFLFSVHDSSPRIEETVLAFAKAINPELFDLLSKRYIKKGGNAKNVDRCNFISGLT